MRKPILGKHPVYNWALRSTQLNGHHIAHQSRLSQLGIAFMAPLCHVEANVVQFVWYKTITIKHVWSEMDAESQDTVCSGRVYSPVTHKNKEQKNHHNCLIDHKIEKIQWNMQMVPVVFCCCLIEVNVTFILQGHFIGTYDWTSVSEATLRNVGK